MRTYSLAHLTTLMLSPPDMIEAAARCGYDGVGLRLIRVTPESPGYPLMQDAAMLRDTKRALQQTGLTVSDIEFVKITPELNVTALESFFATGAELGAKCAIAAPYDPDLARLAETFGQFCDLAAKYNIKGLLEFFPWTVVPSLQAANKIVEAAGRDNGCILIDALHFSRSHGSFADIVAISPSRFPMVHICDAPLAFEATHERLIHHARAERLPPGQGELDLKGLLQHLPENTPIALEVPMNAFCESVGPEAVAAHVLRETKRLMETL